MLFSGSSSEQFGEPISIADQEQWKSDILALLGLTQRPGGPHFTGYVDMGNHVVRIVNVNHNKIPSTCFKNILENLSPIRRNKFKITEISYFNN